jgi:hypothetical protein
MSTVLFIERILWFIVDILILLIVGVVCIKEAVIVGDNAPLISGKKTESIEDFRVDSVLEKTYRLVVRVVESRRNKPIPNVNVKVSRVEKGPITPKQWVENLKNGTPFKTLIISLSTDNNGNVTAELPEGDYEAKVERYGLNQVCELTENLQTLFIEPKKRWWQKS